MKIVCVSDLHWYSPDLGSGDILIICGDSIVVRNTPEFLYQLDFFASHDFKKIFYCAGNHDEFVATTEIRLVKQLFEEKKITYLESENVEYEGLKFYATPYTPCIPGMEWPFTAPEHKLKEHYAGIPEGLDFLITHCPPRGILDRSMNSHFGSIELHKKVFEVKPKHHVFGHIHDSHGKEEVEGIKFYNCSLLNGQYRKVFPPTVIEL